MTHDSNKSNHKGCEFIYDYADRCDCSEDDNCGCTYPNNMQHDFEMECAGKKCRNQQIGSINTEKVEIQTPHVHIKKDSICTCSPHGCECSVTRAEYNK